MEIGQNKIRETDLFDFTSFLAWTFLHFLVHCAQLICKRKELRKYKQTHCGVSFGGVLNVIQVPK